MKPIIAPIKPGESGPQVTNLQEALFLLIDRQVIRAVDPPNYPTLEELQKLTQGLKDERAQSLFGEATRQLILHFQIQQGLADNLLGIVEDKTAAKLNEILKSLGVLDEEAVFVVRGTVRDSNEKPLANVTVRAFDKDLRTEQLLGEAKTDMSGHYQIRYTAEQFAPADVATNAAPDLFVRALSADDLKLAESPRRFNAGREETIDLVIAAPALSEWVIISQAVIPLLIGQGPEGKALPPWELNDEDINFIVEETGLDREQVRLWVLAGKTAHTTNLLGDAAVEDLVEAAVFYAWVRDGFPQDFPTLIQRPVDELIASFIAACDRNIIPTALRQYAEEIKAALNQRRVDEVLPRAKEGEPASLGDLFDTLEADWLKKDIRQKTARLLQDTGVESDEFMPRLKEIIPDETQRQALRRTLRLGELTMKHAPMVKALQPFAAKSENDTITGLSVIETDRWLDLAYEHGVPPASFITPEQYAKDLEQAVEAKAPKAVLAAKLENKTIVIEQPGFSGVQAVLKEHPGFDIASDDIDGFVKNNSIEPDTASALGKLQHLKRLGAHWDEVAVLVNTGINSVAQITEYGSEQFKSLLAEELSEGRSEKIHEQALALQAVSIGLMGYLQPMLFGVTPAVMQSFKDDPKAREMIRNDPTLRKLFGALEQCACDPCMSVLSPAAYLADLLKFIDASREASLKLRRRRPDLYDLELSCDNSKIELPYIDLAIEILENAVAFPYQVSLPVGTDINGELKEGKPVGGAIRDALQDTATEPLGELSAQLDRWTSRPLIYMPGVSHWVVTDRYRRWVLKASNEYFGYKNKSGMPSYTGMDLSGIDVKDMLVAMNHGQVPAAVEKQFKQMLVDSVHAKVPVSVTYYEIVRLEEDRQWNVSFTVEGIVAVASGEKKLLLAAADGGGKETRLYSQQGLEATKQALKQGQFGGIVGGLDRIFGKYIKVVPSQENQWTYKNTYTIKILCRPAGLAIEGLTYQSTAADRDLFVRPQNCNPLAYDKLSGPDASFPWSLPYDHSLAESREILSVAGTSRLSLHEASSGAENRYTSSRIARERLGLSSGEWSLISTSNIVAGKAKTEFWRTWGLGIASASQKTKLIDTFIDKELEEATPFGKDGLLPRISIVLQQARLRFSELQELLQTDFINPGGTVRIQPDDVCKPSEMTLSVVDENVLAPVLDRLHRFVRLWRATGWKIWELDLALQAPGIGNNKLDPDALVQIANLGLLKEKLNLPIERLVAMIGGFGNDKRYSQTVKGEFQELIPLYDRLFQDRRLVDPPDDQLAFSATANSSTKLSDKASFIAAAVGIRPSDLSALLNEIEIDKPNPGTTAVMSHQNLQWIFRNATLAKALRLSLDDYTRAWRLLGGQHFASPGALLDFLDEVDFVRESGFAWSELEYILQGANPDQSEHGFSIQRAAEVLSSLQRELRQLKAPVTPRAKVHFALSNDDLKTPPLPEVPGDSYERFKKHWGLTDDAQNWRVSNPDGSANELRGPALDLLARIDVLAQQAKVSQITVTDALQTTYVAREEPLYLTVDTPVTIKNLTEDHLDRLEIFLALLRSSRFTAQDMGLLLQAFAATNDPMQWELSNLVESGQQVLMLQDRLQLPLKNIINWWVTGTDDDLIKPLAEALGVSTLDLGRLLHAFEAEVNKDPWAAPSQLLEFVDASTSLKQRVELVTQRLAQAVSLDPAITTRLLWEHLQTSDSTPQPAIQRFIAATFGDSANSIQPSLLGSSDEYSILVRLHKSALLNSRWKASISELRWLQRGEASQNTYAGLVLDALPTPNRTTKVAFTDWRRSTALYRLAHSDTAMSPVLDAYIKAYRKATTGKESHDARATLKKPFGFADDSNTVDVAAEDLLGMASNDFHLDPLKVTELVRLLGRLQRLGIDEGALKKLIADTPENVATELGRMLLRPRFGESGWQQALKEVSNALRPQQRDRLVDFLLTKENLRDANALYEYYLIDVEMSPCMNTTRLLQSTAAAQLFVQRCLFNLEQGVPPGSIDRGRWEWMQNYRVWETNRKVFLYPENWLFPEVRDDRTETFRRFESSLTQSEPSHENAVKALRQYLDDLAEVSQISVMGMYEHAEDLKEQDENGNPKYRRTVYLVGRSPNPPYTFYWRQAFHYDPSGIRWTGWERIDQDLSGDHIVPFVFEGDFHIAWPLIKPIKDGNDDYYEVQLVWTRRTSTGWTKRKASRDPLKVRKPFYRDERSLFAFKYVRQGDLAAIACCIATPPTPTDDPPPFYYADGKPAEPNNPKITSVPDSETTADTSRIKLKMHLCGWMRYSGVNNLLPTKFMPTEIAIYEGATQPCVRSGEEIEVNLIWGVQTHKFFVVPLAESSLGLGHHAQLCSVQLPDALSSKIPKSLDVTVNVVFDGGPNTNIQISGETQLRMESVKQFQFYPGSDGVWKPSDPALSFTPPGNLFSWSSGFREPQFSMSGLPSVFTQSDTGQFFALQANRNDEGLSSSPRFWYIEEGTVRFFAKEKPTQSSVGLSVFPAGFDDPSEYKASFARSLDSLFSPSLQDAPRNTVFGIGKLGTYFPLQLPNTWDPRSVDLPAFDLRMPYANYNWEVFYHLPLAAATFLSRQHRFEDARRWFHFVFDPTTNDPVAGRERFWRFLPFRNEQAPDTITQLIETLADPNASWRQKTDVEQQIGAWLEDPFNPFAVGRLRTSAFEWYTVIAYIKNLIEWADQLFRRDTRESINEATLLYVMAAQILGPRPEKIRARGATRQSLSYRALNTLKGDLDDSSDIWATLADTSFAKAWKKSTNSQTIGNEFGQLSSIGSLYFCVPPNEKLPELWDMVDDRLFKIRYCQNIEGVTRSLPLYEPPIDPELLIRAKAAGLDLADVLADRFAPWPYYRFQVSLQKANEFCNEVKGLGAALLSAVEKKEAEHLTLLRSSQEIDMLKLIESVKAEQVKEAQANIDSLEKTRKNALDRFTFLQRQLGKEQVALDSTGVPIVEHSLIARVQETGAPDDFRSLALIQPEIDQVWRMQEGHIFSMVAGATKLAGGVLKTAASGAVWEPTERTSKMLSFAGDAASLTGDGISLFSTNASFWERRAGMIAGWQRRHDEWVQQSRMTAEEIRQIDKQIIALTIRKTIAEKELENHRQQIEHASNIDDYLRHLKFSGESLYAWTESQLSGLYFSAYQLAYDLAKRAERAFRFEVGDETSSFVRYGHWDNLRKGLLSGDRLSQDLRRMDAAYLERNKRDQEITKHVSLRQLDGLALMQLRANGECEFEIPEPLFDLDFPGHFFRRIKSVSISVPCIVGPYTSVSGTLTLLSSKLREKNVVSGGYGDESNYRSSYLPIQSISTSTGQSDSGLFELNFRDERYLPFEGAGAISRWRFKLPKEFRAFDYDTISDVILHIRYTARDGGETLQGKAVNHLEGFMQGVEAAGTVRLFSVRHDFPTEWAKFKSAEVDLPSSPKVFAGLTLHLEDKHYPYWGQGRLGAVGSIELFAKTNEDVTIAEKRDGSGKSDTLTIPFGELRRGSLSNNKPQSPTSTFTLYFNDNSMEDLWLALTWGK